ncbi:MAG: hypothetical protein ACRC8B_04435 [Aeromonas sobria]|uniref:hypothetical protein n=1 Tax=Aeromonas sobria TaxID=646 RepID=UPI003F399B6E
MRKLDALFKPLIDSISNICDDPNGILEAYYDTLSESKQNMLDDFIRSLGSEKVTLLQNKRTLEPYQGYDALLAIMNSFSTEFQDFPGFSISKIVYIISISKVISQNAIQIQNDDVALELYHSDVDFSFNEPAYITQNTDLEKVVIWFTPTATESITRLVQYRTNIECWYALLQAATEIDFSNDQQLIFYSKIHHDAGVRKNNVSALLKMHMASSGLITVQPLEYTKKPSNSSINNFCPSQSYLQFQDVIGILGILGEYNNRKDILSKYLSMFHIIENFMYREPIVGLERASTGAMFSIRDFKRLYKSIDMDEKKALSNLFKKTFSLNFNGQEFKNFAFNGWQQFVQTKQADDIANINSFLQSLSINDVDKVNLGKVRTSP